MIQIDRDVLKPWRDVSRILGIPVEVYLEEYLADIGDCVDVLEEIADITRQTRVVAERIAARLEKFSVDAQLSGSSDIRTVAASVVETEDGRGPASTQASNTSLPEDVFASVEEFEPMKGDSTG